jgi:hypothetical protein
MLPVNVGCLVLGNLRASCLASKFDGVSSKWRFCMAGGGADMGAGAWPLLLVILVD